MTTSPIMSVTLHGQADVANLRNVARIATQLLNFSITDQARFAWAVGSLGNVMLMLGYQEMVTIAHIEQEERKGIQVTCTGRSLHLMSQQLLSQLTMSQTAKWIDEIVMPDRNANPPYLRLIVWAPNGLNEDEKENGNARLIS